MKTIKIIQILCFSFAGVTFAHAQQWGGSGDQTGAVYRSGNLGIGTTSPRGKLDIDGPGDVYLADDVVSGSTQSIYIPGHVYLSPYNGSNISYLQARRWDNSGTTSLRLRTYNNGALTESVHISGDGSVGVGTTSPEGLQVNAALNSELSRGTNNVRLGVLGGTPRIILDSSGGTPFEIDNNGGRFRIYTPGVERFTILDNGQVGIGTTNPGSFKLAVEGNVAAREINVTNVSPWPDFVFESDYGMSALADLEHFIKLNNRLPGVPSAKDVEANGINLGEMNRILLQKVEELTLYLIEKDKEITTLKERVNKMEDTIRLHSLEQQR